MTISSSTHCNPNVTIRAQMSKMPGVTYLDFTHSNSRYDPGFTVTIKSGWFNMTLMPDEVNSAMSGIKNGGLKLLHPALADELMPLIRKGVAGVKMMLEATKP